MVAQENGGGADAVLLRNLIHFLVFEQRRSSATQRAVCGDVNALVLAEVDDLLLWQQRVVFDLVDGGGDG